MSDGEKKDEKLVFHYSRERRLENAPESVRRAYSEGYTPNKGFLRGLTANVGLRSIFFTIIILCGAVVFLTFFGQPPGSAAIGGVPAQLKAFLFDETVYITLTFSPDDKKLSAPVKIESAIAGLSGDGSVTATSRVDGVYTGSSLILRTTLHDYETTAVSADITAGTGHRKIRVQVDRK